MIGEVLLVASPRTGPNRLGDIRSGVRPARTGHQDRDVARRPAPTLRAVGDPSSVLSAAITALLGPERASHEQIRSAAVEIIKFLSRGQATALQLIG